MKLNLLILKITALLTFILFLGLTSCNVLGRSTPPQATPSPIAEPSAPSTMQPTLMPTITPTVIQGTITIWHSWNEQELPALVQLTQEFKTLYPNAYFDVLSVPVDDLRARFEAEAVDGGGPTILFGPAEWGPALFDAGLVTDLSTRASQALQASVNQPALGAARYKGALVGLPVSAQGVVLFRNQSLIPEGADTFDELISNAKTATHGEEIGAMLDRSFPFSGAHLNGLGGQLMDEDGQPAFNNEYGMQWIQLLKDLEQVGPVDYYTDQDINYFKQGRIGIILDGTWDINSLTEALGAENLAIDPWPTYRDGALSGYVMPENVYLSSQITGDRQDASWKFIEYLLSPQAQSVLVNVGRIPVASGVALDPIEDVLTSQAMKALSGGATYPVRPEMEFYPQALDIALQQIFKDGVAPQDALRTAYNSIIAALTEAQATATATP